MRRPTGSVRFVLAAVAALFAGTAAAQGLPMMLRAGTIVVTCDRQGLPVEVYKVRTYAPEPVEALQNGTRLHVQMDTFHLSHDGLQPIAVRGYVPLLGTDDIIEITGTIRARDLATACPVPHDARRAGRDGSIVGGRHITLGPTAMVYPTAEAARAAQKGRAVAQTPSAAAAPGLLPNAPQPAPAPQTHQTPQTSQAPQGNPAVPAAPAPATASDPAIATIRDGLRAGAAEHRRATGDRQ